MKREEIVAYLSILLLAVFVVEVVAPMLISGDSAQRQDYYSNDQVVSGTFTGTLPLLSIGEQLIITNPDGELEANLSQLKKNYSILYVSNESAGLSILVKDSRSAEKLSAVLPTKYSVKVFAVLELGNGSLFSTGTGTVMLNSSSAFRLQIDREMLTNDTEYSVTATLFKPTGELLALENFEPVTKTEFKEIEVQVVKPVLAMIAVENASEKSRELREKGILNKVEGGRISVPLNGSSAIEAVQELIESSRVAADFLVDAKYSGKEQAVIVKSLQKVPEAGSLHRINATVTKVGSRVTGFAI